MKIGEEDKEPIWFRIENKPTTWQFCLGGDWSCIFGLRGKPPNRFYRFMMKWILGIHSRVM